VQGEEAPRRKAGHCRGGLGRLREEDQIRDARQMRGEFPGLQVRQCRRNRWRRCGWGAWGADLRGTGLFREGRQWCAGKRRLLFLKACGRSVRRAECHQQHFRRQPRAGGRPPVARCRPAEALFAASPCAGRAARAWAMRVCAPFHGGRADAPMQQPRGRRLLRGIMLPAREPGQLLRRPGGPQSQLAPLLWRLWLWEPSLWRRAQ